MTELMHRICFLRAFLPRIFLDGRDLFEDEDEIEEQFYDDLLARASKNAKTTSYRQHTEKFPLDDMLPRQIRFDDYPIWKIKCRLRRIQDIRSLNL